jgi:hypothetical protein
VVDWPRVKPLLANEELNFLALIALGSSAYHAADAGEVLSTVERVRPRRPGTWVREWAATAERVRAGAERSRAGGHALSAARAFLRSSMYFAIGSYQADAAGGSPSFAELWELHRGCWDAFCELNRPAGESVEIPYEGTSLPGWFFRGGPSGEPRQTLVLNNGSDGPNPSAWVQGLAPALERGWNAFTFDGPGQNAALVRQHLHFLPDWENVVTPVIDYLLGRTDVSPDGVAMIGVSQGGYWVPRALAFEHRVAAAVADPSVVVSSVMLGRLPARMRRRLDDGDQARFDRNMATGERFAPRLRAMVEFRSRPYGASSPYHFFSEARRYVLTEEMARSITCPILVADPDNEQFWPGQSARLLEMLGSEKDKVAFSTQEGADSHCEPAANALRAERFFDWLDEKVPPR